MAILSKIRDRSMFLILIVGLALFAFVLDPSSIQNFFSSTKVNSIGSVNGEDIDREEFARQVETYRTQSGGRSSQMQAVNTVWNGMVSEKVFADQLEKAGIVVGEKDIWEAMVAIPNVQNSPMFKNEANLFDEEKLKEYIANMKADAEEGNSKAWLSWLATEKSIKVNLQRQAYTTLVSAGLGASLKEGERNYQFDNLKMDAQYVYVPYTSIPDSIVKITKGEVRDYIEQYPKKYKAEATRSIQFVKFDINPSASDEEELKAKVATHIEDKEEYSNAAKATVKVPGLKNATNYEEFLINNRSDIALDNSYKFESQLPTAVKADIMGAELNAVVGPYKDAGAYKISKVVEITKMPDSVKSSHIIVPFIGTTRSTSTKTKEEAKKTVDSIFTLVKNNKAKYTEIADEVNTDGTKGKGGDIGWVRKDQAFSPNFDKDFANFIFKNKAGSIDIVETAFGFHIIKIEEQTKYQDAVKLATYGRTIEASEDTENSIFQNAETLASQLVDGGDLAELAKEKSYTVLSGLNLKDLAENVPGMGSQRSIVKWAFENDTEVGSSKRFDIDINGKRGYAVVVLTQKSDANGDELSSEVITKVRPILTNQKKAKLLADKMKGASLEEIATNNTTVVRNASSVSLASPLLSGVGNEPAVVGAMSTLPIDTTSEVIEGQKGVFIVKVTKREEPTSLDNYENFRKNIVNQLKSKSYQLNTVLEDKADVIDNRAKFF
ncbi:peptidylprolyl isomerase [Lutibacter sp. TH_r2]|uniref:peptidylprolyl isomerase n=1 Tax=Lutibacter sp. TH_r2 TaxID=3082083 RepID=UPI002954F58A|nr:peptidylprolyl isomerase [Lutibacter sp. TH_r2]MDV7187612.1 peptidylprolyl isomerase [Lutibacter sp. TH_r2]